MTARYSAARPNLAVIHMGQDYYVTKAEFERIRAAEDAAIAKANPLPPDETDEPPDPYPTRARRGLRLGGPAGGLGPEHIDFRACPRSAPFLKPYGIPAPWPANRPATWFTLPYGRAADVPVEIGPQSVVVTAPRGQMMHGTRATGWQWGQGGPGPGQVGLGDFGSWVKGEWADLKTFTNTHPWAVVAVWGGMVILGMKVLSVMKSASGG